MLDGVTEQILLLCVFFEKLHQGLSFVAICIDWVGVEVVDFLGKVAHQVKRAMEPELACDVDQLLFKLLMHDNLATSKEIYISMEGELTLLRLNLIFLVELAICLSAFDWFRG